MRTGRACGLLVGSVLILLVTPRDLGACSCVADIPLCESVWAADAVFEGEVTAVEPLQPPRRGAHLFSSRRVQFTVTRVWRGQPAGAVVVMTGSGRGDCGYNFRTGRKYLVYASEHEGRLTTNICSPTKPLDAAVQDVEYLTRALASTSSGRIYGVVRTVDQQPIARYTVVLHGRGGEAHTVTDANGQFEFTGMPQGEYTIRLVPRGFERVFGREDVNLRDVRACAQRDFTIEPQRESRE